MPKYQHIFTDGLDKILSTSTWLRNYGGPDTFVYFTKNKLKGYVSEEDIEVLATTGLEYLENPLNINELFENSDSITQQVHTIQEEVKKLSGNNEEQTIQLFNKTAEILENGYSLYFSTEEFNTVRLDHEKHKDLIENIGKYRLEFIETNILATELLYELAANIAETYNITEKDIQFLTHEEVTNLPQQTFTHQQIQERKEHFLIKKHRDGNITYVYGNEAEVVYNSLVSPKKLLGNTLSGMGASKGNITGMVYILSLTNEDIYDAIKKMPQGTILVTESTQPHLVLACKKASAIVTDEGGILSHAAIVSRELGIPCVVGTRNATELLSTGQLVEVDGEKGIVTILKR